MHYVEYGEVREDGEFIPACGDRAVFILDGRNSMSTWNEDAVVNNGVRRPHYKAYRICQGESFTRSKPITGTILLPRQDSMKGAKESIEKMKNSLFEAAMQIDEFKQLSMDRQGEVIMDIGADFVSLVMAAVEK